MITRLTKVMHCDDGNKLYDYSNEVVREYKDYSSRLNLMFEKLAEYEDLEEQGLLLKLPCKVGTPVWTIVCGITGKNPTLFRQDFEIAMIQYWGTAVFLTKEEAEEALLSM